MNTARIDSNTTTQPIFLLIKFQCSLSLIKVDFFPSHFFILIVIAHNILYESLLIA
jgi:hypothetical protein